MSDQPDPRTFWFKCPRGHVEERLMPGEADPPLLCAARFIKCYEAPGGGIYDDLCGEELRHIGPTVGEWRATNDALHEAKRQQGVGCAHLERLLAESDRALVECSTALDTALGHEGELAAAEMRYLRDLRTADEMLTAALRERDEALRDQEAMRANAAAALRERDTARRAAATHAEGLRGLREAVHAEADRLDDKGRFKTANRLREAVTDSYPGGAAPGLCLPAEPHYELRSFRLRGDDTVGASAPIEPTADWERRRAGLPPSGEEWEEAIRAGGWAHADAGRWPCAEEPSIEADDVTVTRSGERIEVVFLGCSPSEWRAAVTELRIFVHAPGETSGPTLIHAALAELKEARSELRRLKRRGAGGFTIVRDVNQQTEAALTRTEERLREALQTSQHWQIVALWAAQSEGALALPAAASLSERLAVISAAYDAEMLEDSR